MGLVHVLGPVDHKGAAGGALRGCSPEYSTAEMKERST